MCDICSILANLAMIDPFTLISFAENRERRRNVILLLPELGAWDALVGHDLVRKMKFEMEAHNRTVHRGMKMGLVKKLDTSKLLFASVSDYAIQMQSAKLTQALRVITAFGERVAPAIMANLDGILWHISNNVVITRDTWFGLCQHMLRIAAALNRAMSRGGLWPDRRLLQLASARIADVFRIPAIAPPHTLLWDSDFKTGLPHRRRLCAEEEALLCRGVRGSDAAGKRRCLR